MVFESMVCITQESICDGRFNCPDYWDEAPSQCQDKYQGTFFNSLKCLAQALVGKYKYGN